MDKFLKRLNQVIQIEAITSSIEDFLVTHKPFKNLYNFGEKANPLNEEDLYKQIFRKNLDSHQFVVIQGTQGCGKSHLIRWMKVRLQEEVDKNKYAIMLISRSHNTLQDAIKQILDSDIFPDEMKNNQIKRLKEERSNGPKGDELKQHIIFNIKLAIKEDEDDDTAILDGRYRDMLTIFLDDPYIQEKFLLGENTPIEKIRLRMENSGDNVNLDESPIFTIDDFNITTSDIEDEDKLGGSHKETKRLAEKLIGYAGPKLKESIARYLNSKVSKVIEKSEKLKTTDLRELFNLLRIELKKENKSLILFVEDMTSITGLDQALIDVLSINNAGEGDEQFCNIISVVGLTRAYYDDCFPDHYKERITTNIVINTSNIDNSNTFFQDKDDLAVFAGKYINAINLDSSVISNWVKNGADYSDLPVFTGYEKHSWANVQDGGKILTIYPFNKNALWNLYFSIDTNRRTPRAFLHNVLKYLLSNWATLGKGIVRDEGIYNNSGVIKIPSWSTDKHYEQDCDAYNSKDRIARRVLLRVWGDRTTEKVNNKVGDVEKEIFEEFEVSTDIFNKEDTIIINTPKEEVVIDVKQTISSEDKKYNDLYKEIDNWASSEDRQLPSHILLREALLPRILNSIDWNAYNVPRQLVEYISNGNLEIEGQTQNSGKIAYFIKKSLESKYALISLIGFKFKGNNSWNYDNSTDDYVNFMTWLKSNEKDIVDFVKDQKKVGADLAFINIASEYYLKVLLGKINSNYSDIEIAKALIESPSDRDINRVLARNNSNYWSESFEYIMATYPPKTLHSLNMNYFKRMFGDATSSTVSYDFYDLAYILEKVKQLRKINFDVAKLNLEKLGSDTLSYLKGLSFLTYISTRLEKMIEENKKEIKNNSLFISSAIGDDISEENVKLVIEEMEKFLRYLQDTLNISYPFEKFSMLVRGEVNGVMLSTMLKHINDLERAVTMLDNMELISKIDMGYLIIINTLFGHYAQYLTECKNNISSESTASDVKVLADLKKITKEIINKMLNKLEEVE